MRIAHVTDTHFSPLSHIPESRSATYHEDIAEKIKMFLNQVEEEGCDLICHSGDIFHLKASSRYSPEDLNHYIDLFEQSKIPVFSIPGNHDLQKSAYSNYDKSAYKTLIKSIGWQDISYKWINLEDKGVKVNLFGLPYKPLSNFKEELEEYSKEAQKQEGLNIVLVHCDAMPSATEELKLFWDCMTFEDLCRIGKGFHIFLQGHIHQSFPIYKTDVSGSLQIVSKPWSFMRTTKDYYVSTDILEIQHKPAWTLVNIGSDYSVDLKYMNVPCRPFDSAFVKESLVKQINKSDNVKTFLENVKKQYGEENPFKIQDADGMLGELSLSKEVRDLINEYLEL